MNPDEMYNVLAVITGVIAAVLWTIYFVRHNSSIDVEFMDVFGGILCGVVTGLIFPITFVVVAAALVAAIIIGCIKLLNHVVLRYKPAKGHSTYWQGPNGEL